MTADDHLLVGAYALGALDRSEAAAFEAHLARCEACRGEIAGLTEAAALLATVVAVPVPEPLLDRVLEQVRVTPQVAPDTAPPAKVNGSVPPAGFTASRTAPAPGSTSAPRRAGPTSGPRRPARAPATRWLAAAAVVVAVLAAGTMAIRLVGVRSQASQWAAVIDDPAATHVPLRPVSSPSAGAGGVDVHLQPGGPAVVDARALPPLDADHTYELWFMAGGRPVRATTFSPGDDGAARVGFTAPVADPDGFAVTVEPAGGRDTPTLPLVFQAEA
jgi:anti-sigma-K factor RskA